MKCSDIQLHTDDYLDKRLAPLEQSAFESHVAKCAQCADRLEESRALMLALRDLPVPEPSADFERRVFSEVRRQNFTVKRDNHRLWFATGFATAALAGLVIWIASTLYLPQLQVDQPQVISVAFNQTRTVRLLFDSDIDINRVELSIDLPDNIELKGYPGHRGLSWQTSLYKGQNVLVLPITAIAQGQGTLTARLSYGDKVKSFSVYLKTTMQGVRQYRLDKSKTV